MTRPIHAHGPHRAHAPSHPAGHEGEHVVKLQKALRRLGFHVEKSGHFDADTQHALKRFQQERKLPASGVLDEHTRKALKQALTAHTPHEGAWLHQGTRNEAVRKVEVALENRGLLEGKADGFFDAKTKDAVQKLERSKGWIKDGVVGLRMWKMLTGQGKQGEVHAQQAGGSEHGGRPVVHAQAPEAGSAVDGSESVGAAASSHKKGTWEFKTVNINVKSNPEMSQDKVLHDVHKAARSGDLIGWNEISPKRYFDAIKGLGPNWGHYMPHDGALKIPNPISWKKSVWKMEDAGFLKTHGGKAKVSPNRYITWVKLKHRESGKQLIRINTHLVSGAWSEHKATTAWRREQWHKHMEKLQHMVASFEKRGYTVVVGGDFNRDSYKVLGNQVRYDNDIREGTHGKSTYDYVMHTAGHGLKKVGADVQHGYASDHDAVVVKYSLKNG